MTMFAEDHSSALATDELTTPREMNFCYGHDDIEQQLLALIEKTNCRMACSLRD